MTAHSVGLAEIKADLSGRPARTTISVASAYTQTTLYAFGPPPDGTQPSSIMLASNGNFYGTTSNGGPNECRGFNYACGILFWITPSGDKTTFHEFEDGLEGSWPIGPLLETDDGDFYGTTASGGVTGGGGTIFRITAAGVLTTLHSFGVAAFDGYNPSGGLIEGSDGNFYGLTVEGGDHYCPLVLTTCGTAYRIAPDGTYTTLYSFGATPEDGFGPRGELIEASDGNFYGVTAAGGTNLCGSSSTNVCGTVFRMTPSGDVTILHSFGANPMDGNTPRGALIEFADGNFYGTTVAGGEHGEGTFFRIATDGTLTVLYAFGAYRGDGNGPAGPLTLGADGNFYGVTTSGGDRNGPGGAGGSGTVFMVTPDGEQTTLYAFGQEDANSPSGRIIRTGDGSLYGVTGNPTNSNWGTFYRLRP